MSTNVFPIGLLIVFGLVFVIGCADNPTVSDTSGVTAAPGAQGGDITEKRAIQIARAQVAGKVVEVEREVENGVDMWGVEIKTDAGVVKEVEIDAKSGKVLNIEDEDDDDDDDGDDDKFLGIF